MNIEQRKAIYNGVVYHYGYTSLAGIYVIPNNSTVTMVTGQPVPFADIKVSQGYMKNVLHKIGVPNSEVQQLIEMDNDSYA